MNLTLAALAVLTTTPFVRGAWALGAGPPVEATRAQAAALVVLAGLAIVLGPLLATAADISAPTARIAGGLVIAVTTLPDLWRQVVVAAPTTPSWRVGLVPGVVPETFGPPLAAALVLATIDLGVGIAAGLGAAAVAIVAATGRVLAGRAPGRVARAAMTGRAAAAVAVGLALVMHGVYDI